MNNLPIAIRPETETDIGAIRALLVQRFDTAAEADMVEGLRRDRDVVLALVAIDGSQAVVGHVAFSRLHVEASAGRYPAVGLAPVAVTATSRRRGIGAQLVRTGLDRLAARGETLVFVLGDPGYYTRFGFDAGAAKPLTCAYSGPHFMALRLSDAAPLAGQISYPAAFNRLN